MTIFNCFDGMCDLFFIRYITDFRIRHATGSPDFIHCSARVLDVEDFDSCTFGCQAHRRSFANAYGCAGDNGDTILKSVHYHS
jgi:hypothetical protein